MNIYPSIHTTLLLFSYLVPLSDDVPKEIYISVIKQVLIGIHFLKINLV